MGIHENAVRKGFILAPRLVRSSMKPMTPAINPDIIKARNSVLNWGKSKVNSITETVIATIMEIPHASGIFGLSNLWTSMPVLLK